MSSNLPGASEIYRAAWLILTEKEILIEEIDAQETGLGLIGHRNGCLTRLLETLSNGLARCDYIGRIYLKMKKGPVILTSSETKYLKRHLYLDI